LSTLIITLSFNKQRFYRQ